MTDDATICAECKHLYVVNKGDPWWRWLCMRQPEPAKFNPVTGLIVADPPWKACRYVNDGNCPGFDAGPNALHPKETA